MKIDLFENGITAWKEAINSLERIINGDVNFSHYRMFIINLQNALELFFKKMLYDKNEFMIFSFDKFKDQVLNRYRKARKEGKNIFEYVQTKQANSNAKLPDTVKFYESYQRLAYLYNMECFTDEVIANLEILNNLRNNIVHFEVKIEDEILTSLSKLLISCDGIFQDNIDEYGWGEVYISERLKNELEQRDLNTNKLIIENSINRKILETIDKNTSDYIDVDIEDYDVLAEIYLLNNSSEKLSKDDVASRCEMLVRHGFIEQYHHSYSYGNDDVDSIAVIQLSEKGRLYAEEL